MAKRYFKATPRQKQRKEPVDKRGNEEARNAVFGWLEKAGPSTAREVAAMFERLAPVGMLFSVWSNRVSTRLSKTYVDGLDADYPLLQRRQIANPNYDPTDPESGTLNCYQYLPRGQTFPRLRVDQLPR